MATLLHHFVVILFILYAACMAWGRAANSKTVPTSLVDSGKQLFVFGSGKETSPPDFVRLVVMRLIYGLASTMGLEERLEDAFNGAFVPPNADDGFFSFGGSDYDGGDDGGLGALFDDF
ncbi:PREDICTED: uncharacterized protein LOC108373961 [Rhagoletis zephyria]|uniref:uncharacterized protein LOC108373961 n=1 Tax=Rhagoletis zephyria TaxID=28612 RepID=UPI0008116F4A|nr:PREDICTED: uncharacterized protein LOC108373961 [Rhagoletis zephyria]XP_036321095.1 uncharacterized protein LOC118735446 [Rhagoletis pomonella]